MSPAGDDGGAGGAGTTPDGETPGVQGGYSSDNNGGGGGAVGRVRVNSAGTSILAGTVSPPASTGSLGTTPFPP